MSSSSPSSENLDVARTPVLENNSSSLAELLESALKLYQGPNNEGKLFVELRRLLKGSAVPSHLEALFAGLARQNLEKRTLTHEQQEHTFDVLPLVSPLLAGGQKMCAIYIPSQYKQALSILLGDEQYRQALNILLGDEHAAQMTLHVTALPDTAHASSSAQGGHSTGEAIPLNEGCALPGGSTHGSGADFQERLPEASPAKDTTAGAYTPAGQSSGGPRPAGGTGLHFHLLAGVAGVGKSMFLYVLAWALLKLGKTVLWQSRSRDTRILVITPGQPMQALTISDARHLLACENNWYLCDSTEPETEGVLAESVLAASPKAGETYNTFVKNGDKLWFPPWTLLDLLCGSTVSPLGPQAEDVVAGFNVFGGIARTVFMYKANPDLRDELDAAIDSTDTKTLLDAMHATYPTGDMSNKVFHVLVWDKPRPLSRKTIAFASDYVRERVIQALDRKGDDERRRFVLASSGYNTLSVARGYLFEICVDKALMAGGEFELLHLSSGCRLNLTLQPLQRRVFDKLEEVTARGAPAAGLWVPKSRGSWPVADQYVTLSRDVLSKQQLKQLGGPAGHDLSRKRSFLVQSTVAASHGIAASRYEEQSKLLGTTMFVFAVPAGSELSKPQNMLTADGKVKQTGQHAIHQFALLLRLEW